MTKNKNKRHFADAVEKAVKTNEQKVRDMKDQEIKGLWDRIHFLEKENEELKKPK